MFTATAFDHQISHAGQMLFAYYVYYVSCVTKLILDCIVMHGVIRMS